MLVILIISIKELQSTTQTKGLRVQGVEIGS